MRLAKDISRSLRSLTLVLAAVLACAGHSVWSQTGATIRIIIPSAPGGGADLMSRLLAGHVSEAEHVSMVVENRPGAGNIIGTEVVSRAAPDGNTLLMVTPELVINPHLRTLNY